MDREPPIVLFAQRSTPPKPDRREMNGAWRYEPTWPPDRLVNQDFALADAEANRPGVGPDVLHLHGDVGWTAWISCAGAMPWGQPDDQRPDEIHSLTYTWLPLAEELEILGHATFRATVTSSAPIAYLSAKLCDVFPEGASSLVCRGMLNLAHRDSRTQPSSVEPGQPYEIAFELEAGSWTFEAGHRIRLDLAGADWPNAWAPPSGGTVTVDRGSAVLRLPVMDGPSPVQERPAPPPPNIAHANQSPKERDKGDDAKGWVRWEVSHLQLRHETRAYAGSFGDYDADDDIPSFVELYDGVVAVSHDDPGDARAESQARFELRWPEATCASEVSMKVASDAQTYRVAIELVTSEDGVERGRRSWERTFPRDHQ